MREIDRSVRFKVTNSCQMFCSFCHNEGTELPASHLKTSVFINDDVGDLPSLQDVAYDETFLQKMCHDLRILGVDEVHLTGGEPTLNKALPDIVGYLSGNGFEVRMTSNGQFGSKCIQQLQTQGLRGVNFSVISFDPTEFLQTQILKSEQWALQVTGRLRESIRETKGLGINIKVNTVVGDVADYGRIESLRRFCEEEDIVLVLLNNLCLGQVAEDAVFGYIQSQEGKLAYVKEYNSKGKKVFYLPSGQRIDAKYFRSYYPEIVCSNCEYKSSTECLEKFYGIRLEMRDQLYVRLCIQKNNERTIMPIDKFFKEKIYSHL